ncbi:hypothetical protein DEQ92_14735 [Haloferax sp. Atlit-6N]|uniref:hypothetical protein n=1 Tax=Haloferax sp. Atlit-6N TaxID=2077205 RepID=UPI000E25BBA2|nr:hypothetical protein [Haloferax sp. Atlit-6N]REA02148.1 hypothetical protein DEQ92_14735 [Haloferax sp. Atlit-6N]
MAINRRNILIGLGALVGGGGALVGTGAFTTVSAAREVSVSTAGDGSAFLTLEETSDYVSDDGSSDTVTINLGGNDSNGFNKNAITELSAVLTVTNNAADEENINVGVTTTAPGGSPSPEGSTQILFQTTEDGSTTNDALVTFTMIGGSTNPEDDGAVQTLSNGEQAKIDVTVNTIPSDMTAAEGDSVTTAEGTSDLTIVANDAGSS